jgi:hypothetical protein
MKVVNITVDVLADDDAAALRLALVIILRAQRLQKEGLLKRGQFVETINRTYAHAVLHSEEMDAETLEKAAKRGVS